MFHNRGKARVAEVGIDVVLNDVEGEVVGAAERPNNEEQQKDGLELRLAGDDEPSSPAAYHQEESSLQIHPSRRAQIPHQQIGQRREVIVTGGGPKREFLPPEKEVID